MQRTWLFLAPALADNPQSCWTRTRACAITSQRRSVRHRWDNLARASCASGNLWVSFSVQTHESVSAVLSSGIFWLQMCRDTLWCLCKAEERGNWRVWGSGMARWVDPYSIAHISLLHALLAGDTVTGQVLAIQGLWNCTHTCTHLCLKDLFWLLMFLLLATMCSVLILILGPAENSNILLEHIFPNTVVLTSASTLWKGKI